MDAAANVPFSNPIATVTFSNGPIFCCVALKAEPYLVSSHLVVEPSGP